VSVSDRSILINLANTFELQTDDKSHECWDKGNRIWNEENCLQFTKHFPAVVDNHLSQPLKHNNRETIYANNVGFKKLVKKEIKKQDANCVKADLNHINTSRVTRMSSLFSGKWTQNCLSRFNGNISTWDVSNVKSMDNMFKGSMFNGNISNWLVSSESNNWAKPFKIKSMEGMFKSSVFDQDISGWDVSSVKDMKELFKRSRFNGNISNWDVSNVENMKEMFKRSRFNGNISNWLTPSENNNWTESFKVYNTKEMFRLARFKGDISKWDFSNVKQIEGMFWDSGFDCNNINPKWRDHKFQNGDFSSCGVSNIESHLKSVNTTLQATLVIIWLLFLVFLWPILTLIEKRRKKERDHQNQNHQRINTELKKHIGAVNMIASNVFNDYDSKYAEQYKNQIQKSLSAISKISSSVVSKKTVGSKDFPIKPDKLLYKLPSAAYKNSNIEHYLNKNKNIELELRESAFEAIQIIYDSLENASTESGRTKINLKTTRLNKFKDLVFFKQAIEIEFTNRKVKSLKGSEKLKYAKDYIVMDHYGKFKDNLSPSAVKKAAAYFGIARNITKTKVTITLPIKRIENY
jgi:hypothetical protein